MNRNTEEPTIRVGRSRKRWVLRALSRSSAELTIVSVFVLGGIVYLVHGVLPSVFLTLLALLVPAEIVLVLSSLIRRLGLTGPKSQKPEPDQRVPFLQVLMVFIAIDCIVTLYITMAPQNVKNLFRKVEFALSAASMVVADSQGSVYVLSDFNQRVQKYDQNGNFQFGWFVSSPAKGLGLSVDAADNLYLYSLNCEKYSPTGQQLDFVEYIKGASGGWWVLEEIGRVAYVPELREPKPVEYNQVLQPGDRLPSSEMGVLSAKGAGFQTSDGARYTIRYLWWLFPAVEVTDDSQHVRWIRPNMFSMPLSYLHPGFTLYLVLCVPLLIRDIRERRKRPWVAASRQAAGSRAAWILVVIVLVTSALVAWLLAITG